MHTYSEQEKYWIWLKSVPEVTPKLFYYILQEFGDAACFFDTVHGGSDLLGRIPGKALCALKAACSQARVAEIVCGLNMKDIRAVTRLSDAYPNALARIPYPPPVLYVKGSLDSIEPAISIVGTRRCTRKGFDFTRRMACELAGHGMCVVSGMARGIDSAAHRGAIEAGAKTIAVLGCGADIIYPPESDDIYNAAIQNGAVISELGPGAEPFAANFPARNRIIAGLTKGMLIVESEISGGTAISADMAIALGRDIFALPGPPYLPMSALPNKLIKEGANPVCDAADILRFYGYINKKLTTQSSETDQKEEIQLDFLQREIYNLLIQGDMSVESIAQCIKYPQRDINTNLTMMELAGLIKRLPGGKYGI